MPKDKYIEGFRGLAIYQIAGGILGLYLVVSDLFMYAQLRMLPAMNVVIGLGFFSYSIYCGTILFLRRRHALSYSLVNQYMQLIAISTGSIIFKFVAGLSLMPGIDIGQSTTFSFNIAISSLDIAIHNSSEQRDLYFNLVSGGIILFLHHEIKAMGKEKIRDEIDLIGS
ncbi:MAG: hypothetical protein EOO45_03935 [Flavobacterium sp.]|nr:MAG: hypothetical protein EOO45_03935 [Flavobacterium sp.]